MRSSIFLRSIVVAGLLALGGCGAGAELQRPGVSRPHAPSKGLTIEEATRIVEEADAQVLAAKAPEPRSLEDVLDVLRSDEIARFPRALAFARSQTSVRAKALAAQLEIAWGEDLRIVARMVDHLAGALREEERDLEDLAALSDLSEEKTTRLELLKRLLAEKEPLGAAMSRLAPVHLAAGRELAEALLRDAPGDYEGYRILADYYRIRGDWERFDAMIAEVEKRNPKSVGLLFLKGISSAERGDDAAGAKFLRDAVEADPKFARARVPLLLLAKGPQAKRAEYLELKRESPNHQIVRVAGPVIEAVLGSPKRRSAGHRDEWRAPVKPD